MSTMSMDRYFTIRFPFRYGRNKTRRIMFLKIVAVWAISAAVSSPVFVLGIVNKKNVLSNGTCAPNNASFKIYGSIFAFYIPFIIMITTYALTMRSLRNVLVHKRKYNRERRRKQTFRPLAQIISQYAEIAQGIRHTSSANNQTIPKTTTNNNNNNNNNNSNNNNNDNNSILNKTLYTIKKTTSPTDSRTSLFSTNNTNINLQQDNSSKDMTNGSNINNDAIGHNVQHLNLSYIKPNGSKNRCYQQQTLTINTAIHRKENNINMSTVYETTECSKSTSSSNDVSAIANNNVTRRSTFNNDQQVLDEINKTEQLENSNLITSAINNTLSLEEESSTILNMDTITDIRECVHMPIALSSFQHFALSHPTEPIFLKIPWKSCFNIIQHILHYYIFYFPYRLRPLSIKYPSNIDEKPVKVHQSTSISSICLTPIKYHQSVSTQTTPFLKSNSPNNIYPTTISEQYVYTSPKRRKFPFNRSILPSSSLLTSLLRHMPTLPIHSSGSSSKSSFSSSRRPSTVSSPNQIRQPYSSNHSCRIESELEPILTVDLRSRASTSLSSILHTTNRQDNHIFAHYHKPLRRQQYQYRSGYIIPHSSKTRQLHQQLSSPTNTNSSDSSSIMYHYPSRLHSVVSSQQRVRDEDIVAANERKALRVLMIIFCVFVTLWTPFFICTFISAICTSCRDHLSSTVWFSITWLGYSSSMANPFIYTIFSDTFRRAFANIIFCRPTELLVSGHHSTKLSSPKDCVPQYMNQRLSYRRNPKHDISGTSTPILHHRSTLTSGSDAKIYINRCTSDTFR